MSSFSYALGLIANLSDFLPAPILFGFSLTAIVFTLRLLVELL